MPLFPHRLQVEFLARRASNRLSWCSLKAGKVVNVFAELVLPFCRDGCCIVDFAVSESGKWVVTERCSGSGAWGYDVIRSHQPEGVKLIDPPEVMIGKESCQGYMPGVLERVAGIETRRGYTGGTPVFAVDESFLLGGYGERWTGGWWAHPSDDEEEPSRGGDFNFGYLFKHHLPSHEVTWHELRVTVPAGWLPDNIDDAKWCYGAHSIEPLGEGVKLVLAGDIPFEFAQRLPDVIRIPMPHPNGGRNLDQLAETPARVGLKHRMQ